MKKAGPVEIPLQWYRITIQNNADDFYFCTFESGKDM